jgi:hypothetical protein
MGRLHTRRYLRTLLLAGLTLVSRNTLLLQRLLPPHALPARSDFNSAYGMLSVMYITARRKRQYHVRPGKVGNVHYRTAGRRLFTRMFWEGEKRGASGPTDSIRKMPP